MTGKDSGQSSVSERTLKRLIRERDESFARLRTIYNSSKLDFEDEANVETFLAAMVTIDSFRNNFERIVDDINSHSLLQDAAYEPSYQSWSSFEDLYCRCKYAERKLSKSNPKCSSPPSVGDDRKRCQFKLPKLDLVDFSGLPTSRPTFYETFKTTIHDNPELTNNERIQYLMSKLSGRALSSVAGITPSAVNYDMIWETLVNKLEDKRYLATAYLNV